MIVSHKHKFIFVRPRKVAGTSIHISLNRLCGEDDVIIGNDVFQSYMDTDYFDAMPRRNADVFADAAGVGMGKDRLTGHFLPGAIRETVGDKVWDDYYKFTILRNPFDLVVSYIHYKFGGDWAGALGQNRLRLFDPRYALRRLEICRARRVFMRGRYKEAVEWILKNGMFPYIREIPAFYFLDGQEYADCYIRYENLQNDYDEVCRRLQIPSQKLPRTKDKLREKDDDYGNYYTDWSWEFVAELCREMIINWYAGFSFPRILPLHLYRAD